MSGKTTHLRSFSFSVPNPKCHTFFLPLLFTLLLLLLHSFFSPMSFIGLTLRMKFLLLRSPFLFHYKLTL
ncbi:hypothetical protein HanRHA438_Chr17g0795631 [Helianthus annuus]|uniref:Uncharacterized protein n=1 Tax=Helianthus annuus TaxID=4232 RepID=A0A251SD01_HELAN|nr:hypothetical protein HanXRQr2_Chr17g0785011 [Helianthus annuus]KAJ0427871.1 hypothetical protein HanHA300_Chr17g0639911 [Helianthus annuus]KAJ0446177.1 hypothetical protein HanHA89_Chr17g0691471 [Helianthus annuus]KAJ0631131.1 hypothetical protein HanLR1_Chr17g0650681 [Helianthus annuus]KAJ0635006.1 hypothetical protein HanOQP8_Chr17g0646171 [Helianthus annuus]